MGEKKKLEQRYVITARKRLEGWRGNIDEVFHSRIVGAIVPYRSFQPREWRKNLVEKESKNGNDRNKLWVKVCRCVPCPAVFLREYPTRCTRFNPACELDDVKKQLWKIQENIILIKDLHWGEERVSHRVAYSCSQKYLIQFRQGKSVFEIIGLKFVLSFLLWYL